MKQLLSTFTFFLFAIVPFYGNAADGNAALYDVTAPADSAFVRVLNNTTETVEVGLSAKSEVQPVSSYQLGDYLFLAEGEHQLKVGNTTQNLTLGKNEVTTFIYDGQTLSPIKDKFFDGLKKSQVSFYNLTSTALVLKTLNGKHAVVKTVKPGESGSRKVNEVKMAFAAFNDATKVAEYEKTFLKKGRSYSYVVLEQSGKNTAFIVANKISSVE